MNMYNQKQIPELSEVMSSWFPGSDTKKRKPLSGTADKGAAKRAGKRR